MIPELTAFNRQFWTGGVDGRLHVPYCDSCAQWILPPEESCPHCESVLAATNIVDCEPDLVVIGMPVAVRFERQAGADDAVFVPVFAPLGQRA